MTVSSKLKMIVEMDKDSSVTMSNNEQGDLKERDLYRKNCNKTSPLNDVSVFSNTITMLPTPKSIQTFVGSFALLLLTISGQSLSDAA